MLSRRQKILSLKKNIHARKLKSVLLRFKMIQAANVIKFYYRATVYMKGFVLI